MNTESIAKTISLMDLGTINLQDPDEVEKDLLLLDD